MLYLSRPVRFLDSCHRRYGKCFTIKLPGLGTYVFVTDLADIRTIFRDPETFRAGEANAAFGKRLLGSTSVLLTDGARHRRQRRLMMPAFHGQSVAALASLMADIAARDIETWPVGETFPVWPRMRQITFEVILRTVIGADDEERLAGLRESLPKLANRWFGAKTREIEQRANAALYAEITRCMDDPALDQRNDVLAMMARARGEDGSAMTRDELRDQLITLLVAGHETTATGLAWALERLVRHPQVLARAQRAARDGDDRYLDAIVAETLRVRPVITDVNRKLSRPAEVSGYLLPAGTIVNPAITLVQRDAGHYPQPLAFDPDRFASQSPDPDHWLPFGGGNRRCLGAAFASVEMRVVLREILRRVELQTTASRGERPKMHLVMVAPHKGALMTVRRRVPAGSIPAGSTAGAPSTVRA